MEYTLRGYIGLKKTPQSKERWRHTFHTKDRWRCSSLVSIPACQGSGIRDESVPCVDADLLWTLLAIAIHFRNPLKISQHTAVCRPYLVLWFRTEKYIYI